MLIIRNAEDQVWLNKPQGNISHQKEKYIGLDSSIELCAKSGPALGQDSQGDRPGPQEPRPSVQYVHSSVCVCYSQLQ